MNVNRGIASFTEEGATVYNSKGLRSALLKDSYKRVEAGLESSSTSAVVSSRDLENHLFRD